MRVLDELREALAARGFASVRDVVGLAHRPALAEVSEDADPPGGPA